MPDDLSRPPVWGPSPQEAEIAAIAEALNCCGQPILERIEEFYLKDRGKTNEINRLVGEVRAQEAEIARLKVEMDHLRATPAALVDTALEDRIHEAEDRIARVEALLKKVYHIPGQHARVKNICMAVMAALQGETP